jgi:hypothetical protein
VEAIEGGVPLQVFPGLYGGLDLASDDGKFHEIVKQLADSKNELFGLKGFVLRHVNLWGKQFRDEDLQHLKGLKGVQTLNLAHTAVSDRGLEHLRELSGLTLLRVNNTAVTAAGVRRLQQALPSCVIATQPAIAYAKLAAGKWTRVLDKAEDVRGDAGVKFINGTLELSPGNYFPVRSVRGQDLAIRAQVKKPWAEGNLGFRLRYKALRWGCTAYFDGGRVFGMGQHKGKWVNFMGVALPREYKDFFEMTFAALGETLAVFVDGQQIMEYRDSHPESGEPGISVTSGPNQFKLIEVQELK